MSEHLKAVVGYDGPIEELAAEVAHLDHAARAEFILSLAHAVRAEAANDFQGGRPQLAGKNYDLSALLLAAWRISAKIAALTAKHPDEE